MVQPRTLKSQNSPEYQFRCPSCLSVLSVQGQMAGTTAPCPLCAANIIAPPAIDRAIPMAQLGDVPNTPFSAVDTPGKSRIESRTHGRSILVDDKINRGSSDAASNGKILFFVILTAAFCALGAWLMTSF